MTKEQELAILMKMEEMPDEEWELYRQTKEFRTLFKQAMKEIVEIKKELQSNKTIEQKQKEENISNE